MIAFVMYQYDATRAKVLAHFKVINAPESWTQMVAQVVELSAADEARALGDTAARRIEFLTYAWLSKNRPRFSGAIGNGAATSIVRNVRSLSSKVGGLGAVDH